MIAHHPSPLGSISIRVEDARVVEILIPPMSEGALDGSPATDADRRVLAATCGQLDEYFAGRRTAFELPLAPRGTPFQRTVWDALVRIPHGGTRSYGELARTIGRPTHSRAVGAANGRNRIAIVIPCHRVIGSSGALTGYAAGVERKAWLLAHEAGAAQGAASAR